MSLYETPEMDIMLYARVGAGGRGDGNTGTCPPESATSTGGDVVETSGNNGAAGGAFGCSGIGPSDCGDGGAWTAGGCKPGDGSGGADLCDGTNTAKVGSH